MPSAILRLCLILTLLWTLSCAKEESTPTLTISPARVSLQTGQGQQFTASESGVSWVVAGIPGGDATHGTISSGGYYTAPATVPFPDSVFIGAATAGNARTASAVAIIHAGSGIQVTLAPDSVTLALSATQQFTSTVTGTTNTGVTWRVDNIAGGNATVGTVSATGLYTAPGTMPASDRHLVTAISSADTTAIGSAVIRLITGGDPGGGSLVQVFNQAILVAAQDMVADGNYLYVVEGSGADRRFMGLRVLSIASPENPSQVGTLTMTDYPVSVAVKGSRAYVVSTNGSANKLRVIDISNPASPTLLRSSDLYGAPRKITVDGNTLYATVSTFGIQNWDITSPDAENDLGGFSTLSAAQGVGVSNGLCAVAEDDQGLQTFDVSNPAVPVAMGHMATYRGQDARVQGRAIYLADGVLPPPSNRGSSAIFNATDARNFYLTARDTLPASCRRVHGNATYAYFLNDSGSVTVWDVYNLSSPSRGPSHTTAELSQGARNGQALTSQGNYIYAACMGRLVVFRHDR